MKAVVCVKVVDGDINPFDSCALETALRTCDDVSVISMCPISAKDRLKALTRLGVKVFMLCDNAFAGSDTLATSYVLSQALKKIGFDIIFCGRQTLDGDTAQVGPCLAEMLKIPSVCNVMEVKNIGDGVGECITRMGEEKANLPALFTIERICSLRFPAMRAKTGEVEVLTAEDISADKKRCGLKGSPTKVLKVFENKIGKRKCKFITRDQLLPLIVELKTKNRRETEIKVFDNKIKNVWAVGEDVLPHAKAIGENVKLISVKEPKIIAEMAKKEKPDVLLWNSDLWGRRYAPAVAAILSAGLCADCTKLETDGTILYMYRPARSGNVVAKIKCDTVPQMATVRCVCDSGDIIVSAGKGVLESVDKVKAFAEEIGAEFGASRGIVDMGLCDYECQIGLTGKTVSPKVYIAAGISGAVQHTCAIENAETIIAINPDKSARIFDYADYGILDEF